MRGSGRGPRVPSAKLRSRRPAGRRYAPWCRGLAGARAPWAAAALLLLAPASPALAAIPSSARADAPPPRRPPADRPASWDARPWLDRVREAAFDAARRPLDDPGLEDPALEEPALDAARLEVRRAALGRLPALRLGESGSVGWDGAYRLTLDAAVSVPLLAPAVAADRRLAALRLAQTRRQLAAQRRGEVRDRLAQASALALSIRQVGILDRLAEALANDLVRAGPNGAGSAASGAGSGEPGSRPAESNPAGSSGARPEPAPDAALRRTRIEAALRVAGRRGLARRAAVLRAELQRTLGVELPGPEGRASPGSGVTDPRAGAPDPATREPAPLPFGASDLDPARCLAGSDAVALAQLARREHRAGEALRAARSATRVALELGGGIEVTGPGGLSVVGAPNGGLVPSAHARLALAVRLPPWRPAAGAATLAAGADGVEQTLDLSWPNRSPAPPPDATAGEDAVVEARRQVRRQLSDLTAQELELRRRADLLSRALGLLEDAIAAEAGSAHADLAHADLADAALRADLALDLADVDHALALTALDAALLCGALPP